MKKNHFFTLILVILFFNSSPTKAYSITGLYQDANNVLQPFSKYEGKLLLVEGFATDCPHCQDEHKELDQLWESYDGTINLLSLSVSSDDTLEKINDYLVKYPTPWDIGRDIEFSFRDKYGIQAFPSLLLFTETGEIASCHVGERSFADLSSDIDSLMADPVGYLKNRDSSCELDQFTQFLRSPLAFLLFLGVLTLSIYKIIQRMKK
ncbi:MAG: Thiol-disulfide oxidoreductase ResA [Candidatus Heimdallarchaeota archaeon LC_2]|nr:MAG: Thiol-disulfide oxidoreductase ResA [Candidatus Heimdallarchaeota archaeon LC_2]